MIHKISGPWIVLQILLRIPAEIACQDIISEMVRGQHPAADKDIFAPSAGFASHGISDAHVQASLSVSVLVSFLLVFCSTILSIMFSNIESRIEIGLYDIITFVCNYCN